MKGFDIWPEQVVQLNLFSWCEVVLNNFDLPY